MRRLLALCLSLLAATPAAAQGIVTSARPDRVAVTVYRDPNRPAAQAPNIQWLNGVALISETRRVTIPVGTTDIRFEGVAGGIIPQSAIVTGLPEGFIERNRDAWLLSPATLLDRSLGRRVHLRRTSHATGRVREQEAIIRSGAGGAVVLETEGGFEALRCTGLSERLVYDRVPPGLSSRPTLSVRARATRQVTATVTLSYLASGFDWQADYVATVSPENGQISLFAWLTLANSDETGFSNASTQAVAGRINRRDVPRQPSEGGPLNISCWPWATTSDIPLEVWERMEREQAREEFGDADDIAVTAGRMAVMAAPPPPPAPMMIAQQAQQEDLGDLKLYRIPEPVTVAARSQKQVALLQQPQVQVRTVYRQRFSAYNQQVRGVARRFYVTRNRREEGLGLPLPAGTLMLFDEMNGRQVLVGQAVIRDFAIGEEVEIDFGEVPGIFSLQTPLVRSAAGADFEVVVTNDRPYAVAYELEISAQPSQVRSETRLGRRNGMTLWSTNVPANGSVTLRYRVVAP